MSRLQFDPAARQAYFFDFKEAFGRAEAEAAQQRVDLERQRNARRNDEGNSEDDYWRFEEQQIEESIKESVENIIQHIAYCKENGLPFTKVEEITDGFSQYIN